MPVGGHNVTGCLGYVNAAAEIMQQIDHLGLDPGRTTIVTAAGTGGTLAGLLAGIKLLQSPVQVLGLDIGKLWRRFGPSVARLAGDLCTALGEPSTFTADALPLIERRYAGPGYARVSIAAIKAIRLMARTEGILLDPVYAGKAFAGLLDLVDRGRFGRDDHVIFLHTGGLPGLWAYGSQLDPD
jgi:D-cysteine desulfhydrase